jgi:predicted nucleic acid-binding protein
MVVFDASVLIDLFNPRPGPRKEKIDHLMANLSKEKIVIPAPAYIEFLTLAGKARQKYHEHIEASSNFRVEPLSKRASVECAILLEAIFQAKQKRDITKTKLKFDWMIVAIAKTLSPQCVYACDEDIVKGCMIAGLKSVNIDKMQIPQPTPVTGELFPPL